jgi:DNA polymerase III gamma/tau subunit
MIDKDNMEKGGFTPLTEVEFEYYLNKKETPKEKESIVEKVDNLENELKKLEQLMKIDEKENEQEHKEIKKEIKSEKKEMKSEKKDFKVEPLTGSKTEMTKQYKKQALKFHPDKNIGREEEAKKAFQELTTMYEKLMGDDAKEVVDEEEDKFNSKASFVNIKIMSFIKKYDTAEKRKEKLNGYMEYIKENKKYTAQEKKDLLKRVEMFKKDEDYLKFIGSQSTKKLSMDELNKALNEWYQLKFIGNSKRDVLEWCKKYSVCENKSYQEIQKTFKL